jgi:hypothetical protein
MESVNAGGDPAPLHRINDEKHLRLLVSLTYGFAVFMALFAVGQLPYWRFRYSGSYSIYVDTIPAGTIAPAAHAMPPGMIAFITAASVVVAAVYTALAVANVIAAGFLRARRGYVFLLVIAALNCAIMPLIGTALGVFALVVLLRPSVKALFEKPQGELA